VKKVIWNTKALEFVRSLDNKTKREIGTLLMILQAGEKLCEPQSKPMKVIHSGAYELRIKDNRGSYRVIYVLAVSDKVLIPQKEIQTSRKRLQELLNEEKS